MENDEAKKDKKASENGVESKEKVWDALKKITGLFENFSRD